MALVLRIARELWELFVDDGSLAVLLLAWTAVVGLGVRFAGDNHGVAGPLLAAGLVAILIENVRRSARAKSGR